MWHVIRMYQTRMVPHIVLRIAPVFDIKATEHALMKRKVLRLLVVPLFALGAPTERDQALSGRKGMV
jgi:hypothetical protein